MVFSRSTSCEQILEVLSVAIAGNVERLAPFTMKCWFFFKKKSFFVSLWTSHRAASPCSFACCHPKKKNARLSRCRAFMPVPGPLQTVQRAEFWGAILALRAFWPGHPDTDNLNVVRFNCRLLDRGSLSEPLPLVKDGDFIAIVQHVIHARGSDTVKVTKVKGHATEADVESGLVGG